MKIKIEIINSYMESEKIGIREMSRRIDVSPSMLCKLLKGKRNAGNNTARKLIRYFGSEKAMEIIDFGENK